MIVSPIKVTAFEITGVDKLDPIRVILQELSDSQGRLIIECFGRAWSGYWGSMGTGLIEFLLMADTHYIAMRICQLDPRKMNRRDEEYLMRVVKAVQDGLALIRCTMDNPSFAGWPVSDNADPKIVDAIEAYNKAFPPPIGEFNTTGPQNRRRKKPLV